MGCDIHGFIDYDEPYVEAGKKKIDTCNFAKVRIGRDYSLFNILAGVRCYGSKSLVSKPKGMPENMSWQVRDDVSLYITDIEEEGHCTKEQAEKWGNKYFDKEKTRVWHPDWHSHSWLSTEEVAEVIKRYKKLKDTHEIMIKKGEKSPRGYKTVREYDDFKIAQKLVKAHVPSEIMAIHGAMKALEKDGKTPRFIFYFDN